MRAHTTVMSPPWPLPIHFFFPSMTHESPSLRAVVSRATASEPWVGSVSANAPSFSARASGPSQASRCSGEPHWSMACIARPACTAIAVAMEASARETSMVMSLEASGVIVGWPGTSTASVSRPCFPASATRSVG